MASKLKYKVYLDSPVAAYIGPKLSFTDAWFVLFQGFSVFARSIKFPDMNAVLHNDIILAFSEYELQKESGVLNELYKINPTEPYVNCREYYLEITGNNDEVNINGGFEFLGDYDLAFRQFICLTLFLFESGGYTAEELGVKEPSVEWYLCLCDIAGGGEV